MPALYDDIPRKIYFPNYITDDDFYAAKRLKIKNALRENNYDVINLYGDGEHNLTTLETKVIAPSGGFLFLPIPYPVAQSREIKDKLFEVLFQIASLSVGVQTRDPLLMLTPNHPDTSPHKPIVIINPEDVRYKEQLQCWTPFQQLVQHLNRMGTVTQNPTDIFDFVSGPAAAVEALIHPQPAIVKPSVNHDLHITLEDAESKNTGRKKPDFTVCVFCSASTKDTALMNAARDLGRRIGDAGWGLVTGAGMTGSMGAVNDGMVEIITESGGKRGWTGGSNLLRIFNLEGLPPYMDEIWITGDIYTRMEKMIAESDAFVILPGGMGTVQEFMALMLLRHKALAGAKEHPHLMRGRDGHSKPVVVVNQPVPHLAGGQDVRFWDPLIELGRLYGFEQGFIAVDTAEEAVTALQS